jgi:hypothetical protein
MENISTGELEDVFDRRYVLVPGLVRVAKVARDWKLQRCSSSTLLTIAIPEHSTDRTEETSLLQSPRGLWNVLNVNSSIRFASQPEHPSRSIDPRRNLLPDNTKAQR